MSKNPLILTFDLGTQSSRAMLVDKRGDIVCFVQHKYEKPYYSKNPNWAEVDPSMYYDAVVSNSNRLFEKAQELWNDIIGVTVTTIRDTAILVDNQCKPLRDFILWLDKREANHIKPIPAFSKLAFKVVNMDFTVAQQRKYSVCNYLMHEEKEIFDKAHKFLLLSTYINYHMTGKFVDSVASMIGHIPIDYKNKCWYKNGALKRCIFDIPQEKLCDIVAPGAVLGGITKEFSKISKIKEGLPLIATGSDKGCETLGVSCVNSDTAALSFGTTATVQLSVKKYFEPQLFAPAYPAVFEGKYNPEVQIYRGYWLISWFKKEFAEKEVMEAKELGCAPEDLLNKRLKEVPAGCEGLVLQPYWTPGVVTPYAKGAIIGFSDVHTRIHIYRAIIEGIGFGLYDGLKTMEKRGKLNVKQLFVSGGGSVSDEICQITANMFGLPVKRIQTHEATGIGASMVAFVALKEFDDFAAASSSMVRVSGEFLPDKAEFKVYKSLYENVYSKIYKRVEPLYKKIRHIIKNK